MRPHQFKVQFNGGIKIKISWIFVKFFKILNHVSPFRKPKFGLQSWLNDFSTILFYIMTLNSYLIWKYEHFPLSEVTKQSVRTLLFFTPFPSTYQCKMQTVYFYIKTRISNLLKSNATVIQLVEQPLYFESRRSRGRCFSHFLKL